MSKENKPKKAGKVSQSNALTEAAYYLPLQAKRVLWLCLIQSYNRKDSQPLDPEFVVRVADYQELFGVSQDQAGKDVRLGADQLISSAITFYFADGEFETIKRPWLAESGARRGRGQWVLTFNDRIMKFIQGLTDQFTTYSIFDCGKLTNVRAIRLYESLCQFRSSGIWVIPAKQLAAKLELPPTQRANMAEMKRGFLVPSLRRINETTPITAEYSEDGNGNLVFTILKDK